MTNKELVNDSRPPFGNPGEPVPEVDPEDLKALWQLQREIEQQHPGQQVAIGAELAKHYCKPGANIQAIGYRVCFLWLITRIAPDQFAALTKNGQPTNTAFRAAAKVPAEWMGVGVVRQSPPFDIERFFQLCTRVRPTGPTNRESSRSPSPGKDPHPLMGKN